MPRDLREVYKIQTSAGLAHLPTSTYTAVISVTMKTTLFQILLASLWFTPCTSASWAPRLPTRILAGVTVPDTPLIRDALEYAHQQNTPRTYNHVVHSWLYGVIISSKIPAFQHVDKELLAVSAILHDLGWDPAGELVSPDKRFEVDGANAAREFIRSKAPRWDRRRQQLVWDSIALHTTPSIATNKEVEVAVTSIGIGADFSGPNNVTAPGITWDEWNGVAQEIPREGFKDEVKHQAIHLCQTKKATTADNLMGEYGEKYIPGFNLTGYRPIDFTESGVP